MEIKTFYLSIYMFFEEFKNDAKHNKYNTLLQYPRGPSKKVK